MHEGVSVNRSVGTAAVYAVPYMGYAVSCRVDVCRDKILCLSDMYEGVSVDTSHLIILRSLSPEKSSASSEDLSEDVTSDDVDHRLVVLRLVADEGSVSLVECGDA